MKTPVIKSLLALSAVLFFAFCKKQSDPVVTLNGNPEMMIYMGESFSDPGASAKDYKGKDISSSIFVSGNVGTNPGSYSLDYSVKDKKGNESHVTRNINRGFKNSQLVGNYAVVQNSSNNVTQNFNGSAAVGGSDIYSLILDNSLSITVPEHIYCQLDEKGTLVDIKYQSTNGFEINSGSGSVTFSLNQTKITFTCQTTNGSSVLTHTTTYTKL
jgi:hypothetical protein